MSKKIENGEDNGYRFHLGITLVGVIVVSVIAYIFYYNVIVNSVVPTAIVKELTNKEVKEKISEGKKCHFLVDNYFTLGFNVSSEQFTWVDAKEPYTYKDLKRIKECLNVELTEKKKQGFQENSLVNQIKAAN